MLGSFDHVRQVCRTYLRTCPSRLARVALTRCSGSRFPIQMMKFGATPLRCQGISLAMRSRNMGLRSCNVRLKLANTLQLILRASRMMLSNTTPKLDYLPKTIGF